MFLVCISTEQLGPLGTWGHRQPLGVCLFSSSWDLPPGRTTFYTSEKPHRSFTYKFPAILSPPMLIFQGDKKIQFFQEGTALNITFFLKQEKAIAVISS